MKKFFDSLGKVFGGDSEDMAPSDILPKLTSITPRGRRRLAALLELESHVVAEPLADIAALDGYLHELAATGEAVRSQRLGETLRVHAHAFVGDITLDDDGWLRTGRFGDSGRDDRFATLSDLIWGGLVLTGRPSVHIQRLYALQRVKTKS